MYERSKNLPTFKFDLLQNEIDHFCGLYFLSLVSAIFLPLGFLTGLLGVNIGGIPGADNAWAFATFCGILISLVALQMALFYRFKWL